MKVTIIAPKGKELDNYLYTDQLYKLHNCHIMISSPFLDVKDNLNGIDVRRWVDTNNELWDTELKLYNIRIDVLSHKC